MNTLLYKGVVAMRNAHFSWALFSLWNSWFQSTETWCPFYH